MLIFHRDLFGLLCKFTHTVGYVHIFSKGLYFHRGRNSKRSLYFTNMGYEKVNETIKQ